MKKRMSYCKKHKAFSVAEMLVVMLILAIVILAMTPVAVKRVKKEPANPDHGSFECFYDGGTLRQRTRNEQGTIISQSSGGTACSFAPKRGVMFLTVNAIGGGSPGAGMLVDFANLPRGTLVSGSTSGQPGVNYVNDFYKHNGLLINTDSSNNVNYSAMPLYSDTDANNPRSWLINNGVTLKGILTSDAGDLNTGGFMYVIHNTFNPCISYNNPYGCNTALANKCNSMTAPDFTSISEGSYDTDCFTPRVMSGVNPKEGSRAMIVQTLMNGNSIVSAGEGQPELALGAVGCKVNKGGSGCYNHTPYSCSPAYGSFSNYGSGNCPNTYRSIGGGYLPEKQTNTCATLSCLSGFEVSYSNCDANLQHIPASAGTYPCTPSWIINNGPGAGQLKRHQHVWGRLVIGRQELRKGVNFYAHSGNPGEYRTIYISKLKGSIKLVPGAPSFYESAPATKEYKMGNDTRLCYPAAGDVDCTSPSSTMLLKARGGKKTEFYNATSNPAKAGDTFILGNLFTLKDPGTNHVIAHNTTTDGDVDDTSGYDNEYGTYFKTKESSFVYPIPDSTNAIPETVGQGGGGAYTVHRLTSKSNVYELWRVAFGSTYSGGSYQYYNKKTNAGGGATIANAPYTCTSSDYSISGNPEGDPKRSYCYGGSGGGGAIVISW